MKKLLAIVLVLMLVTGCAAFAETATVVTYTNPVITLTQNGETQTAQLSGLDLTLAMGLVGEEPALDETTGEIADTRIPTILLDATKEGETLLSGEVQFVGTAMVMNLEGMSRPIAVDLSMAGDMAVNGYRQMFAALPEIAKAKLPAFTGVNIPMVNMMDLIGTLSMLGIEAQTTETTASFELPAELVNMLLQMVISQLPEEMLQSTGLSGLLQNGAGFALKGDVVNDAASSTLVIGAYPSENGVTAETPFLTITFVSAENADTLTVDMYMGDQAMTIGQLALTSLPDQAELDLSLQLMQGMMSLAFSLYPQDGLQVGALEINVNNGSDTAQKLTASMTYGEKDGVDFNDIAIAVDGQATIDLFTQTTGDGSGNASGTGTLTVDSVAAQTNVVIDSEIAQSIVEGYTFRNIENVANAIDATTMTEEENAQLQQEVGAVMNNLLAAFGEELTPAA